MCTAITLNTADNYFGRNLDLDISYGEEVCVVPRNFPFSFRKMKEIKSHFAIIGMATVVEGTPLFYDAANEYGLSMAGLNFPNNAYFPEFCDGKDNVTPFEFISWILSQCKTISDARVLLNKINLVNIPFSENLPLSPLHWIIADKCESVVVESMKMGLHIHDNPTGVLTNNPPFEYHLFNLNNYRNLSVTNGECTFSKNLHFENYSQGLGAIGLPGDVSSMSRFIRAVFGKENSACESDEMSSVSQFFHLLSSVATNRGICKVPSGRWNITVYSSCINTDKGLYYYTTYDNQQINCIDMHRTDLDANTVYRYPLVLEQGISHQN